MTGSAGQAAKKGRLLFRLAPLAILGAGLVLFFVMQVQLVPYSGYIHDPARSARPFDTTATSANR